MNQVDSKSNARTKRFYNLFQPFYPLVNLFLSSHKRKLKENLDQLSEGKLLDVGVGSGEMLPLYTR
ncbi:MAG: hypothetical protein AAF193_03815, partial [Bacteroidota bacterium]